MRLSVAIDGITAMIRAGQRVLAQVAARDQLIHRRLTALLGLEPEPGISQQGHVAGTAHAMGLTDLPARPHQVADVGIGQIDEDILFLRVLGEDGAHVAEVIGLSQRRQMLGGYIHNPL